MIAFKVRLNGETLYVVGQPDASILHTHVYASAGKEGIDDYVRMSMRGLSHATAKGFCEHLRYKSPDLKIGDTIEIEILNTDEVDTPTKRYRSDHEVQESPYTEEEMREMRYQDYLMLKKEFEPGEAEDAD
ncbi:MAG: hypothetical protein QNI99_16875 [Woeseiaceae bacterium]|nr:hypothetical protein [Woeseiaceae bacterium]